jgi:hypothetical protein
MKINNESIFIHINYKINIKQLILLKREEDENRKEHFNFFLIKNNNCIKYLIH